MILYCWLHNYTSILGSNEQTELFEISNDIGGHKSHMKIQLMFQSVSASRDANLKNWFCLKFPPKILILEHKFLFLHASWSLCKANHDIVGGKSKVWQECDNCCETVESLTSD